MGIFDKKNDKKTHQEWINLIKEFKTQYNRFPKSIEKHQGLNIGSAYYYLKREQRLGKLPENEIKQLEKLGTEWSKRQKTSAEWVELILLFYKKYKRLPSKTEDFMGEQIGTACNTLRLKRKKGKLNSELIIKLSEIDFVWEANTKTDEEWVEILSYKLKHDVQSLKTPKYQRAETRLRRKHAQKKLKRSLIRKLDKAGFDWNPTTDIKTLAEKRLSLLKDFKKKHARFPEPNEQYKKENIGKYLTYFKKSRIKGSLKKETEAELNSIGFVWYERKPRKTDKQWLNILIDYKKIHGTLPTQKTLWRDEKIGQAYSNLKRKMTKGNIDQQIANKLNILANNGDIKTHEKPEKNSHWVKRMEQFYKEHAFFPKNNEVFKGENVGRGALYLRERYKNGKLNKEIVTELEKINFHWHTPRREILQKKWALLLKDFYDTNQRMPNKGEYYNGFNMGNIFDQLNCYKPTSLTQEVIDILHQTSFVVNPLRKIKTPYEIMAMLQEFKLLYNRKPTGSEFFKDYNLGRGYWYLKQQFLANKLPKTVMIDFEDFNKQQKKFN